MAFRKKFRGRGRRFRAPLARKRRTWVSAFRSGCNFMTVPWDPPVESCSQQIKLVLLDNALLQSGFSDRATVRRIVGDIWVTPLPDFFIPATPEALYLELAGNGNALVHMGLLRKPVGRDSSGSLTTPNYLPIASDFDQSDAEWLKTWQHMWAPNDGTKYHLSNSATGATTETPVYKPDVHTWLVPGTAACNELATGSGFICIETTGNVDCEECDVPAGNTGEDIEVAIPQKWHTHFDMKRRIPLREDHELYLHLDWAQGLGTVPAEASWFLYLYASIKLLVEF